jgi:hypothetical protein
MAGPVYLEFPVEGVIFIYFLLPCSLETVSL